MAVNVGNPSAHGLQCSFRAGGALKTHAYPQIMSLKPSAENWPHLVQNSTRKFLTKSSRMLKSNSCDSSKISESVAEVHAKINSTKPPRDVGNVTFTHLSLAIKRLFEALEESPLTSISKVSPSSEKIENLETNPVPLQEFRQGEILENRMVYRQKYAIRSYEVGADKATPITTIFSFFQDVSLCHLLSTGIAARDGFGATKAMVHLGLFWVVTKIHVEVEELPEWSDVIEIECWLAQAGKNSVRYDWIVRRHETNEVLVRATSTWCMMDFTTRRVCKMPDAVRAEMDPFFWDGRYVFQQKDILSKRITKLNDLTAKYMTPALKCCRADLDSNQHVTNSRYIGWLLQSVPEEHMETHSLTSITIEYRRECLSKDTFDSLTSSKIMLEEPAAPVPGEDLINCGFSSSEFTHLLRAQDSAQREIVRARTTWRTKPSSALSTKECRLKP